MQKVVATRLPERLQLPPCAESANMDNTVLGGYAGPVLALEAASALLGEVQSALRAYLERKRLIFPRFYFLADSDVLEILANANSRPQQTLAPHVKKLFGAVETLEVKEGRVTAFTSQEGERVELKCQVIVGRDAPELWLNRLDLAIKDTLKVQCLDGLGVNSIYSNIDVNKLQLNDNFQINNSYQHVRQQISCFKEPADAFLRLNDYKDAQAPPDLKRCSGEIACLVAAVRFAAMVENAMIQKNEADIEKQLKGI